jgi:hypothetical protein
MSINADLLENAQLEISDLCEKVGFRMELIPTFKNLAIDPPRGTTLWASDYASLLLWPIQKIGAEELQLAAEQGQSYFDELLGVKEAQVNGRVVDGYLILALPTAPTKDLQVMIRELELSFRVCRKHIIWPSPSEDLNQPVASNATWARIADVTVLGLPVADTAGSADVYWPRLDKEAERLWRELEGVNPATLARQDGGEDL